MNLPLYRINAFSNHFNAGNPAAVCFLDSVRPDEWMQQVASEMALSETAFLLPEKDGYRLRWFTPKKEVRLCGHATLASAHILWESGRVPPESTLHFYTLSGELTAQRKFGWVELNFPAKPLTPALPPTGLLESLGLQNPLAVLQDENIYVIEAVSAQAVRDCQPNFSLLQQVDIRSVAVTARSDQPGFDFISRYFAPRVGVNEDPVTGSIHCRLTPYWSQKLNKMNFTAFQASARSGILKLQLTGERVFISGQAVTLLAGSLIA